MKDFAEKDWEPEDMFINKKHPGPKTVPNTSREAYSTSKKKLADGMETTLDFIKRFPGCTAYELLNLEPSLGNIYDLRRKLSALKAAKKLTNPSEKKCVIKGSKMFTWRAI